MGLGKIQPVLDSAEENKSILFSVLLDTDSRIPELIHGAAALFHKPGSFSLLF